MAVTNPLYAVYFLQNLLDICLESAGEIDGLFACASLNSMGITDDLTPGQTVFGLLPAVGKLPIVNMFKTNPPASGFSEDQAMPGGIGFMKIGSTFKVS